MTGILVAISIVPWAAGFSAECDGHRRHYPSRRRGPDATVGRVDLLHDPPKGRPLRDVRRLSAVGQCDGRRQLSGDERNEGLRP